MSSRAAIGLEVHVQLNTRSKMFCGCRASFGAAPNTNVCPVCLGYPGAMPAMNEDAIRRTVIMGLMVGSSINAVSKFDRKSYFYPDMPKNYQSTQYDQPLCVGGTIEIEQDGARRAIRLRRIHLEEDVAKNMHFAHTSGVDFNRAGVPLMEIVTEPDLETADEAMAFLLALKQIIQYAGVSDCNLEEGNIRCDVNCSIRPEGTSELGTKAELKNLNTFKGVHAALQHEIERQLHMLEHGGRIEQETRRWDGETGQTYSMRSKEEAHDYRYFPEPDLMPVALPADRIEAWRRALPELPGQRVERLAREYGLPAYDARVLVADKEVADFFEAAAREASNPKAISNWVMTEVLRHLSETGRTLASLPLTPRALAVLTTMTDRGALNSNSAKEVFAVLVEQGGDPEAIVRERGLLQVSDPGALETLADQAIAGNPKSAADFRAGKTAALQFLVGQVMKMSKGKANPGIVQELLKRKLAHGG